MTITKQVLLDSLEKLPDYFSLEELLSTLSFESDNSSFEKGTYSEEDKISDFTGIWANDQRSAKDLRQKAWERHN